VRVTVTSVIKKLELVGTVIVLLKPVVLLSGILPPLPFPVKVRVAALAGRVATMVIALTVLAKTTPTPERYLKVVVVFTGNFE
jgi:hypothetical protein